MIYLAPGTDKEYINISVPRLIDQGRLEFNDGNMQLVWNSYWVWKIQQDVEITHLWFIGDEGSYCMKLGNPEQLKKGKKFYLSQLTITLNDENRKQALT